MTARADLVVDVHCHMFPQSALDLADSGTPWFGSIVERGPGGVPVTTTDGRRQEYGAALHFEGPDRRLRDMDRLGIDVAMLSLLPPLFRYELPSDLGLAAARAVNDELADYCARWPDRFLGLATLPLQDEDAAIEELRRATNELGLVGVAMGTSVLGRDLDDPRLAPVFEAFARERAFVFVHPAGTRRGTTMGSYFLANLIGNPWETTMAIASLAFGGVYERNPGLTMCFAHAGGYAAMAAGRLEHGHRVRRETRAVTDAPPGDTIGRIYVDSLAHDEIAIRWLVERFGIGQVLLGTDFPADMGPVDPVAQIRGVDGLSNEEQAAILGGNVLSVLESLGRLPARFRVD
jgi:aminocarboxymuconate-semialdehyde decarboxylase